MNATVAWQDVDEQVARTGARPVQPADAPLFSTDGLVPPAVPQLRAYMVLKAGQERRHLQRVLRVEVSAGEDFPTVVYAPDLNLHGYGVDLENALDDLGGTALSVWRSHHRTPVKQRGGSVVEELARLDRFLGNAP